jgi:hypothetical protein
LEDAHPSDYFLKVKQFSEYMLPMNTPVINFECVHECIKLDKDVELSLFHKNDVVHIYARQVKLSKLFIITICFKLHYISLCIGSRRST